MSSKEIYPISQEDLPLEVISALEAGPGLVERAADLLPSNELELVENFVTYFMTGPLSDYYRQQPCFQRYAIVYPGDTAELLDYGKTHYFNRADTRLKVTYDRMRVLVDTRDPYVMDANHNMDRRFLLQ
jgi:hypothetical protein